MCVEWWVLNECSQNTFHTKAIEQREALNFLSVGKGCRIVNNSSPSGTWRDCWTIKTGIKLITSSKRELASLVLEYHYGFLYNNFSLPG